MFGFAQLYIAIGYMHIHSFAIQCNVWPSKGDNNNIAIYSNVKVTSPFIDNNYLTFTWQLLYKFTTDPQQEAGRSNNQWISFIEECFEDRLMCIDKAQLLDYTLLKIGCQWNTFLGVPLHAHDSEAPQWGVLTTPTLTKSNTHKVFCLYNGVLPYTLCTLNTPGLTPHS